jgi:tRNA (adenine22-N1)-methyltransferase
MIADNLGNIRIQKLLSYIDYCDSILDIGCDHGYLGLGAKLCGVKNVYLTDISEICLNKAKDLLRKYNVTANFYISNGIPDDLLKTKIDYLSIMGIGGKNTINILKKIKSNYASNYIFQPMSESKLLREYLINNNYNIIKDVKIEIEDRFYDVIIAKLGKCSYDYLSLKYGKDNVYAPQKDFLDYLSKQKNLMIDYLSKVANANKKEKILKNISEIDLLSKKESLC